MENQSKQIKTPYFKQDLDYTCGPASLRMLIEFFGKKESEKHLKKISKANKKQGTNHSGLIKAAREEGFYCYVHENASINQIKHFIDIKLPAIINYIEPKTEQGHYALVTGYNKRGIIMHDPFLGREFRINTSELEGRWYEEKNKRNKKWLFVLSKSKFNIGRQYSPIK